MTAMGYTDTDKDTTPLYGRRHLVDMCVPVTWLFTVQMDFLCIHFYLDTLLACLLLEPGDYYTARYFRILFLAFIVTLHSGVNVCRRACVLWVCFVCFRVGVFIAFSPTQTFPFIQVRILHSVFL